MLKFDSASAIPFQTNANSCIQILDESHPVEWNGKVKSQQTETMKKPKCHSNTSKMFSFTSSPCCTKQRQSRKIKRGTLMEDSRMGFFNITYHPKCKS